MLVGFFFYTMTVDILNKEIEVGDECIVTINNKGLLHIRVTRMNKTSLYYDILNEPIRKVNRAKYVLLSKTIYNIYKIC